MDQFLVDFLRNMSSQTECPAISANIILPAVRHFQQVVKIIFPTVTEEYARP